MKYLLLLHGSIMITIMASCQTNELKDGDLTPQMIPKKINYKGKLVEAKKWTDKNGQNLLVISINGPDRFFPDPKNHDFDLSRVGLYESQYLINTKTPAIMWQDSLIIKECPTDMWLELFPNSTSITDLDNNGIKETTLICRHSCRGDVSPSHMKVIIHEGKQEYSLEGFMYIEYEIGKIDKNNFEFNLQKVDSEEIKSKAARPWTLKDGRFKDDFEFKNAPPQFLIYAKTKWVEYCDKDTFKQFYKEDFETAKIPDKR